MNFAQALECGRNGLAICRQSDTFIPTALVFVPGRTIETSFGEMVKHLGKVEMTIRDHFDAVKKTDDGWECIVGYTFSQEDILAQDWFVSNHASELVRA